MCKIPHWTNIAIFSCKIQILWPLIVHLNEAICDSAFLTTQETGVYREPLLTMWPNFWATVSFTYFPNFQIRVHICASPDQNLQIHPHDAESQWPHHLQSQKLENEWNKVQISNIFVAYPAKKAIQSKATLLGSTGINKMLSGYRRSSLLTCTQIT